MSGEALKVSLPAAWESKPGPKINLTHFSLAKNFWLDDFVASKRENILFRWKWNREKTPKTPKKITHFFAAKSFYPQKCWEAKKCAKLTFACCFVTESIPRWKSSRLFLEVCVLVGWGPAIYFLPHSTPNDGWTTPLDAIPLHFISAPFPLTSPISSASRAAPRTAPSVSPLAWVARCPPKPKLHFYDLLWIRCELQQAAGLRRIQNRLKVHSKPHSKLYRDASPYRIEDLQLMHRNMSRCCTDRCMTCWATN